MNQQQAIAALRKLFGKAAAYRRDEDAPKAEERLQAWARAAAISRDLAIARASVEARRAELLKDPEYRSLIQRADELRIAQQKESGESRRFRVTVGRDGPLFFEVLGQGDNWDEAIAEARAKVAKVAK